MGLNHLEAEHPCKDYGAKCRKCRLRPWCMTVREKPPEKEEHRCQVCVERESCPAFETGVAYPCRYFEEEKEHGQE